MTVGICRMLFGKKAKYSSLEQFEIQHSRKIRISSIKEYVFVVLILVIKIV